MIAQLGADILAKVKTVPALATQTGLTIGGHSQDPGLLKVSLPAAWIVMKGDQIDDDPSMTHGASTGFVAFSQTMLAVWSVTVFVPYVDDNDLLTVQYPLLELVINAVHGTATIAHQWCYIGQKIALVFPDRLAYELRFSVNYPTQA